MEYQQHPLSSAFPRMNPSDYKCLIESIKNEGLLNPIVIYEGMIIDGWHRYNACKDAGIKMSFVEYIGDNPKAFVIAQNRHRRHLSTGQMAAATISVYKWRKEGRKKESDFGKSITPTIGSSEEKSAKEMAEEAGVSQRSIATAKKIARENPEVFEKVKSGDISLYAAAKQISDSNKDDDFHQDNDEYTEKDFLVDEIDHLASIIQEQMEIVNRQLKSLQLKALQLRRKHWRE